MLAFGHIAIYQDESAVSDWIVPDLEHAPIGAGSFDVIEFEPVFPNRDGTIVIC
jgi:hypothetical protein